MQKPINQATPTPTQQGLVISYFGSSVAVEAVDGQVFQCHLRRNQTLPVVGDRVEWTLEADNTGLVTTILPRRNVLARGDVKGMQKPIAANIDFILIVMAPPPILSPYLLDRYLMAAEQLGIEPVIVVNKADLLTEESTKLANEQLAPYRTVPYLIEFTSTLSMQGMAGLSTLLAAKTAVLVGPSGVGKSSIITALGAEAGIRVGDVSPKGAGKHTTTATRLYHLPNRGQLIDSPGVREFNLWPIAKADVLRGFKEFTGHLRGCKFRDCGHVVEPGCAVQAAVENGMIARERFESYQAFMREAEKHEKNNRY